MTRFTLKFYERAYARITVLEAASLLQCLGCGEDSIYRYSTKSLGFRPMTLIGIATRYAQAPLCVASNYAPIEFVGGPPGKLRCCRGTLLTMLLDRITVIALLEGADAIDQIIPPNTQAKITT